jgi:hypothetical protein
VMNRVPILKRQEPTPTLLKNSDTINSSSLILCSPLEG